MKKLENDNKAGPKAFEQANARLLRETLAYGKHHFDAETGLVRGEAAKKWPQGRPCAVQCSIEYAAALCDTGKSRKKANTIIEAVLNDQWRRPASHTWQEGNFLWWHDQKQVSDPNAVAFLTPWLCYVAIECEENLSHENRDRIDSALPGCLHALRNHPGAVHYDNIWLLRGASLMGIARRTGDPGLLREAFQHIEKWMTYIAKHGIAEYNSPCYTAISVDALQWILRFLPAQTGKLRNRLENLLAFMYADVLMQWHWDAGIGAGTHSRAYKGDRETGKSHSAVLVFKQCGGKLRHPINSHAYSFAVNDFSVPERIREAGRSRDTLELEATHPVYDTSLNVERSLYLEKEISLGTQSGRRPHQQDIPFKITYAGTRSEQRSSYLCTVPHAYGPWGDGPSRYAALQKGPAAVVLCSMDMDGTRQNTYARLVIDPGGKGMIDELLINGDPWNGGRRRLKTGTMLGWRVNRGFVVIQLLEARGIDPADPGKTAVKSWTLTPVKNAGLCLQAALARRPETQITAGVLSCGFTVRIGTTKEFSSLSHMMNMIESQPMSESGKKNHRDVTWDTDIGRLHLAWKADRDTSPIREVDGRKLGKHPRYQSPLVTLKPNQQVEIS